MTGVQTCALPICRLTPREVVTQLRKQIVDRHEALHLLDEWDPRQQIYERFYSKLGNRARQYQEALAFYAYHGEVNAMVGELRYGHPLMALDRLLSAAELAHSKQEQRRELDDHERARLWVRDNLAAILDQGWAERIGMKIVPGSIDRLDQIKIQFYVLALTENRVTFRALADALAERHQRELVR